MHVETGSRHRSIIRTEKDPVINLCPDLEGSWLCVPKPMAPDTVGYWPKYTKFPGSNDLIRTPSDAKKLLPIKFMYYIENELLRSFLAPATKLVDKDSNLWLNPEVFYSAEFHVPSSNSGPWVDRSLRAQLLDNLITDELIDMSIQLIDRALDIPTKNPRRGVYCLGILQGILVASGFRQSLRLSTLSFSWFFPRLVQSGGKLVVNREHYRLILHFLSSRFFHPGSGLHF